MKVKKIYLVMCKNNLNPFGFRKKKKAKHFAKHYCIPHNEPYEIIRLEIE